MNIYDGKMFRKSRNISNSSVGRSRKNNGNVKSLRVILKKLTRKEVAELQSGLLESCSKDLAMTTEIVPEQNPTSDNLTNHHKFDDSSYLIEENSECVDENPWYEEDNQAKNAVSSECNSSKYDQTLNSSHGSSPGRIDNNVVEDIDGKKQETKLKRKVKNSVRESGNDDPNGNYKLPSIYMTSEAKMVAKVILRKMTEEDIANFTQNPKQSQTEQDVGVKKDAAMPEFDGLTSNSDSDFTDSEITRVIKKRTWGRGAHKRTPVDSDSDAIPSSSDDDDDDYNVEKEVEKEIHKTSSYDRTNFRPERQTTQKSKRSRTATETEKLSGKSRKEAPEQDVGVEKDTTMPEIDGSSSNSDSASTDSKITYVQIKKRKRGRGAYKRTPVDSDSDAILSSSDDDDDYNVEKEVVKKIHKTTSYDRKNSEPNRRPTKKRGRLIESSDSESQEEIEEGERNKRGKGVDKNRKEMPVHVENFAR